MLRNVQVVTSMEDDDIQILNSDNEQEYKVEKILKKRVVNGEIEYLVKWLNFPNEDNTWELEKDLDCPDLILSFEKEQRELLSKGQPQLKTKAGPASVKRNLRLTTVLQKFAMNGRLYPSEVCGVMRQSGHILYLVKWRHHQTQVDLVPEIVCRLKCPQLVIDYFVRTMVNPFIVDKSLKETMNEPELTDDVRSLKKVEKSEKDVDEEAEEEDVVILPTTSPPPSPSNENLVDEIPKELLQENKEIIESNFNENNLAEEDDNENKIVSDKKIIEEQIDLIHISNETTETEPEETTSNEDIILLDHVESSKNDEVKEEKESVMDEREEGEVKRTDG
ncbi:hypothetical protein SNEBB_006178 [Seison nebaliae]|nr:hypothetical protein SNEBB_006178 [Seison nebaliae]